MQAYLAGPMRGHTRYNFDAFADAATKLRELGYDILSPAEHDLEAGFDPELPLEAQAFDLAETFRWDIDAVLRSGCVILLPGWETSAGVAGELAVARAVHRDVYAYGEDRAGVTLHYLTAEEQIERANSAAGWTLESLEEDTISAEDCEKAYLSIQTWQSCHGNEVRVTDPATGGQKGQKLARFDLIPADALFQLAEHYGRGARKYDDNNWRRGYSWRLSFAAMQRHAWEWFGGADIDKETGSNHLVAVAWHAFTLLTFAADNLGTDDRWVG